MALGMKHWIGLAIGGCGLIALWLLPPSSYATGGRRQLTAVEQRANALRSDVLGTVIKLQRLEWSDSLSALALADGHDGLVAGADPSLFRPEELARVRELLETEMSRLPRREDGAVVGFFIQPSELAWSGQMLQRWGFEEMYLGSREGRPYCFRVIATSDRFSARNNQITTWRGIDGKEYSTILGACRLVAEHGLPGPRILAWMERGATAYGAATGVPSRGQLDLRTLIRETDVFGRRRDFNGSDDVRGAGCQAGAVEDCVSAFVDPVFHSPIGSGARPAGPDGGAGVIPWNGSRSLGYGSAFLLSDLERQFGAQRFHAFWTSKDDVPTAFRNAFGQPLDKWLMTWVAAHEPLTVAGPRLLRGDTLGFILLLSLSAIVGGFWARRRKVA